MSLAEIMSRVRFHSAMRKHIREHRLPAANRSKDATERGDALRLLNHHSRAGYQYCLQARAILRGEK